MAVAEARKMDDKDEGATEPTRPAWLTWVPRKLAELKTFFVEVRSELRKVTWPNRQEVQATTVVVIITTVFFGFYLYGLDILLSGLFTRVLR